MSAEKGKRANGFQTYSGSRRTGFPNKSGRL